MDQDQKAAVISLFDEMRKKSSPAAPRAENCQERTAPGSINIGTIQDSTIVVLGNGVSTASLQKLVAGIAIQRRPKLPKKTGTE